MTEKMKLTFLGTSGAVPTAKRNHPAMLLSYKKENILIDCGGRKISLLNSNFVNINTKGKKKKVEIKNVLETPSNRFLARQNILTRGTVIDTELGKVRITNRPSQEGMVNGILIE